MGKAMAPEMLDAPAADVMRVMEEFKDTSDSTLVWEYTVAIQQITHQTQPRILYDLRLEILRRMYEG